MRRLRNTLTVVAVAVVAFGARAAGATPAWSVDELWKDFDPRALPLETEVARERTIERLTIRTVYYTSEVSSGHKVRVVAYYGFPSAKAKLPAVLHIHGGGQTATREYVEYWAERGYAALSINWGGYPLERGPEEGNTGWGPINANQRDNTNTYRVSPDPKVNSWYHWTIACRRGLTFLEQQPEVDAKRIGIYGVSMGGRLTWLVAGLDERVKAAISIYGAVSMSEPIPGIAGSEQVRFSPPDREVWKASLETDVYAPRIRCPFLYLSAANDFYGAMDFVDRALRLIPLPGRWQSYTPHYNHHVRPEQAEALPRFMDRWLKDGERWPRAPEIRFEADRILVTPDRAGEVSAVLVYASSDPYPQSRFWRWLEVVRHGQTWRARRQGPWAFANVHYRSGLWLSTPAAFGNEPRRGEAAELLIDDFRNGAADWFVPLSPPNPLIAEKQHFRDEHGSLYPHEDQGHAWRAATRKVGDPKWRGPAGAALQLRIRSERTNTLAVVVTENEQRRPKRAREFIANAALRGGPEWQTVRLPMTAFQAVEGGGALASWDEVNLLSFEAQHVVRATPRDPARDRTIGDPWQGPPPAFARVEWVAEQKVNASRSAPTRGQGPPR